MPFTTKVAEDAKERRIGFRERLLTVVIPGCDRVFPRKMFLLRTLLLDRPPELE